MPRATILRPTFRLPFRSPWLQRILDALNARTRTLTPVDQGRVSRLTGSRFSPRTEIDHDPNDTSLAFPESKPPTSQFDQKDYRGYLIFKIPPFSNPIRQASLTFDVHLPTSGSIRIGHIALFSIEGDDATFDEAFDEENRILPANITPNFEDAKDFYNDLGDGSEYGKTGDITNAPGHFGRGTGAGEYTIDFAASGVADVNAARGQRFAIGIENAGINLGYEMIEPKLTVSTLPSLGT